MLDKPNTTASDAATPYWADVSKWADQRLSIDVTAVQHMSMRQLRVLSDCLNTISQVAQAITCQPRCYSEADDGTGASVMNPAGNVVDEIVEFLGFYRDTVIRVARASAPTSVHEVEERAWAIVDFEADMADCMLSLASTVADENKRITTAKLQRARRA